MALTCTDRGISGSNTSQASTSFSPSGTIAAGSCGVFCFGGDNANGSSSNLPTSVTDSVGNVWRQIYDVAGAATANATVETSMYYCKSLTTQLTSSDTFTITYTAANVTAKCGSFIEIAPTAGNHVIYRLKTGQTGTSGTPTTTSDIASVGDVTVGLCAAESADTFTGDSDTTNGSWSTKQSLGEGTGATGASLCTQQKVQTTANSSQTFNPTLTSADYHIEAVTFKEVDTKVRAASGRSASSQTWTIVPAWPMTAGSTGVIIVALDNSVTGGGTTQITATAITDSAGNSWTLRQDALVDPGAASAGAEIGVWTSTLTANLSMTDTIVGTVTTTNVGVVSWIMFEFPEATAYANSGTGGVSTASSTPSITTGSITTPNIVVAALASEGDAILTPDSDTTNGTWSTGAQSTTGSGGAGSMSIMAQYKAVTGTATQTYNPTIASNQDNVMGWAELTVPGVTNTQYLGFLNFMPVC